MPLLTNTHHALTSVLPSSYQLLPTDTYRRYLPVQAGVYEVGAVVGLASCVWPYARLGLLLLCLWAPPARLPPRRCLLLLRAADSLGKFALVDFVMLNLLTAVFKIDASLPHATHATHAAIAVGAAAPPAAAAAAPFLAITARVSEMSWYLL